MMNHEEHVSILVGRLYETVDGIRDELKESRQLIGELNTKLEALTALLLESVETQPIENAVARIAERKHATTLARVTAAGLPDKWT